MDPFLSFPPEIIVKICNNMETPDLLRMSEASSRVYQVCNQVIENKRLITEERRRKINELEAKINQKDLLVEDLLVVNKDGIIVNVYSSGPAVSIGQHGTDLSKVPWILPKLDFKFFRPKPGTNLERRFVFRVKLTPEFVNELATNLCDQGYS